VFIIGRHGDGQYIWTVSLFVFFINQQFNANVFRYQSYNYD